MRRRFVIVGAGGQARETSWLARELGHEVVGFVVSDLGRLTDRDSRELVLGDYEWLSRHGGAFDALALGIGTPAARCRVAEALEAEFDSSWWPPLVHPSNPLDRRSCRIEHGVMIAAGSVATVAVGFEPFAMANFGCTIGHETVIGRGSVINPGANLSGGVTIARSVLIGTGAQVLQYLTIGENATVGAGAVVTRDVEPGVTVVGAPAKPLKKL